MLLLKTVCQHGVDLQKDSIKGVRLSLGERIYSPVYLNAAGASLKEVGKLLGVDLPTLLRSR